jgi:glycine/D-amino acid oxidase-like deaminating enzyme
MAAVLRTAHRRAHLAYSCRRDRIMPNAQSPIHVDVCIVGTGFAGLSAAIVSGQTSQVAVLEKMPSPGGNSVYNAGQVAVAGSSHQKRANIEDSVERMVEDMLRAGKCVKQVDLMPRAATLHAPAYDGDTSHTGLQRPHSTCRRPGRNDGAQFRSAVQSRYRHVFRGNLVCIVALRALLTGGNPAADI